MDIPSARTNLREVCVSPSLRYRSRNAAAHNSANSETRLISDPGLARYQFKLDRSLPPSSSRRKPGPVVEQHDVAEWVPAFAGTTDDGSRSKSLPPGCRNRICDSLSRRVVTHALPPRSCIFSVFNRNDERKLRS